MVISTEREFDTFCSLLTSIPTGQGIIEALLTNPNYPYLQRIAFITQLRYLPDFVMRISHYPRERYYFSPRIEALLKAIDHCGLPMIISLFKEVCSAPYDTSLSPCRGYVVHLLTTFQLALQSPLLNARCSELKREAQRNCDELETYIDHIFSHYSKLLVIRVDLAYQKGLDVSLETLESDLKRFHSNRRHNALFDDMLGYVTKIEYGIDKKLHVHALFFFNGHKHREDITLGKGIGEYWVNTIAAKTQSGQSTGIYWNCNHHKAQYAKLGIGDIHCTDSEKRQNLMEAVRYLCKKTTQLIKPHHAPMTKLLRRGQCKVLNTPKLGRPRNALPC